LSYGRHGFSIPPFPAKLSTSFATRLSILPVRHASLVSASFLECENRKGFLLGRPQKTFRSIGRWGREIHLRFSCVWEDLV